MTNNLATMYARAFRKALEEKEANSDTLVRNLVDSLHRHRVLTRKARIVSLISREIVRHRGGHWIEIETARPLSATNRDKAARAFAKTDHLEERTRTELIAGIRIIVDGQKEYDGSLKKRLDTVL